MTDKFTNDLKRLLALFEKAWVECEAYHIMRTIETEGQTANWERALQAAQVLSRDIFQPAQSDLDNQSPLSLVLEKLLERLAKPRK